MTDGIIGSLALTVAQTVATIEVTPVGPLTLTSMGATVNVTAVAKDGGGADVAGVTFAWASDNEAAATVAADGTVTAMADGVANITASASGVTSNAVEVTVANAVATIEVTPVGPLILTLAGATESLTAVAKDAGGFVVEGVTFAWASDNEAAATVDTAGTVTAVEDGVANITASSSGETSNTVEVTVAIIRAAAIVITPNSGVIQGINQTLELSAEAFDSQDNVIPGKLFSWSSFIPDIASVNGTGEVTGVGGGQTVIIAEADGIEAFAVVTVRENIGSVNFWTDETSGSTEALLDVWGNPTESIFTVGGGGTILHNDGSGWSTQTSGVPTTALRGVWGLDASEVWAVGDDGTILRTTDGGATWNAETSNTTDNLSDVWGAGRDDVFAVGAGGILHYDGDTWQTMTTPVGTPINGVYGFGSEEVFAVGTGGEILHYDGATWSTMTSGTGTTLEAVWGRSPTDVFAVGVNGTALHYDGNAGGNWSSMTTNTTEDFRAVGGEAHVLAVGTNGVNRRWDGVAWNNEPDASGTLNGIWSGPDGRVRAVGDAGLIRLGLRDATLVVTPDPSQIDAVGDQVQLSGEVLDVNNDVVASGDIFGWSSNNDLIATVSATGLVTAVANGTVTITASISGVTGTATVTVQQVATVVTVTPDAVQLTTGTASQSLSATAEDANANPIAGATFSWTSRNDNIATVDASGLVTQVAAGQAIISADLDGASGFALVTSTGAFGLGSVELWSTDNSNTTAQFTGVWGSSRSDIYAVASNGVVMNFDGTDWVESLNDPSVNWNGVWGLGPSAILAVGSGGRLGLFDGSSWSMFTLGAGENLLAVWGTSPVDIFAVGSNGTIVHYDGSLWAAQTSGTTEVLHNVWGTSSSDVFAVGASGTILHYDGASWSAHTSGTTTSLFGLWGTAPDDVFVAGVSGETHHYDGASWSMMTSPNTFGIFGLWGTDDGDLYGVGDLGTTVYYNGSAWSIIPPIVTEHLADVWGTSNPVVIGVGDAGVIQRGSRGVTTSITPTTVNFDAFGSVSQLTPEARDQVDDLIVGVPWVWTSSDDLIATVDQAGEVTSVGNGSATITASTQGFTLDATVDVAQVSVGFGVVPNQASLQIGETVQLVGGSLDANDNPILPQPPIMWSTTDNGSIATVDGTGLVTGVGAGTATITADDGFATPATATITVTGPNTAVSISAGDRHSCAIAEGGLAYCWGLNNDGELGDGTTNPSSGPVQVAGGPFVSITAGGDHSCGLVADGSAYCWGRGGSGELGDNTFASSSTPVAVAGGLQFAEVSAGRVNTCGITTVGVPYCWGYGPNGAVGDGTSQWRGQPEAVAGGHTFQSIATGGDHACGVDLTGSVYCWGKNSEGRLGDGTTTDTNSPVVVSTPAGVVFRAVSAGSNHTCALVDASSATDPSFMYCWGHNAWGQLGDAGNTDSSTPVRTFGAFLFGSIEAGQHHTCATTTADAGLCWGYGREGQVGNGSFNSINIPTTVSGGLTLAQITAGRVHSCARSTGGDVYCWGSDDQGALGTGDPFTFQPTFALGGVVSVTNGERHTCVLSSGGSASCFGQGGSGQLGQGLNQNELSPVAVSGGLTFVSLEAGGYYTCGLETSPGDVYCWGDSGSGQLGNGSFGSTNTPVLVTGSHPFVELANSREHSCGITDVGAVYCWGRNDFGPLGNNSTTNSADPVLVSGGNTYAAVASGHGFTCALTDTGLAHCWGRNDSGQLGDATNSQSLVPVTVAGGAIFTRIEAGGYHACALDATGALFCWGSGGNGQRGNNQFNSSNVPQAVAGGFTFTDLVLGYNYTCAIRSNTETTMCWGQNFRGELGDGTFNDRGLPTTVSGGHSFANLDGGDGHTCGVTTGDSLYCWGSNDQGQLGLGFTSRRSTPVLVSGGLTFMTPPRQ